MSTKHLILDLLAASADQFVSGESLAERLGVSRAAIWKAISGLRADGHCIEAITHKGYRLTSAIDIISAEGIQRHLKPSTSDFTIEVLDETESTNTLARQRAREGARQGYVVIANRQTKGKGRRGKHFFSPPNTGLYLSLVLRPDNLSIHQATKITTIAAVAACQAIEAVSGNIASIKWVNDVFVNDRKACGILTEASCNMESGCVDYAVLGIGINAYPPANDVPDDLQSIIGYALNAVRPNGRNQLAAEFLDRFMDLYRQLNAPTAKPNKSPSTVETDQATCRDTTSSYVDEYRKRCFILSQPITVLSADENRHAYAIDIDDDCRLIVRYENGEIEALNSGEISVRVVK